ncbi:hypothetical protein L6Q96_12595 [Candidatus Binatia bacterium]|nr:hypothetical protein [Candidatus Binatia bacterium]
MNVESADGGVAATEPTGQIVVIRPDVVDTVGHVLGNLFQRIYHLVDRAELAAPAEVGDLNKNVRRLEDFLQLVMDYISPVPLVLEYVPATEVAQSLARQVSDTVGCAVRVDARVAVDGRSLVDPGRLARAFRLLARQLEASAESGVAIELKVAGRAAGRTLSLKARVPGQLKAQRSSDAEMEWAVAERLIELHGGGVRCQDLPNGDATWEISLPLQP